MDDSDDNKKRSACAASLEVEPVVVNGDMMLGNDTSPSKKPCKADKAISRAMSSTENTSIVRTNQEDESSANGEDDDSSLPPLDDCLVFLKRNAAMRKIIGFMMEEEKQQQTKKSACANGNEKALDEPTEDHLTLQQLVGIVALTRPPRIKWNREENAQDYSTTTATTTSTQSENNNRNSISPDMQDVSHHHHQKASLPERLPKPYTALRTIIVHFDSRGFILPELVRGFTLSYSDGSEVEKGDFQLRGTSRIVLQLQPDEHVIAVQTGENEELNNFTQRIQFLTTLNRCLLATTLGEPRFNGEIHILPQGQVLHNIEWDASALRMTGIQTKPLAQLQSESSIIPVKEGAIPLLQTLAFNTVSASITQAVKQTKEGEKAALRIFARKANDEVEKIYQRHLKTLERSQEVAMVKLLPKLLAKAHAAVDLRLHKLKRLAEEEQNEFIDSAMIDQAQVKREWATKQCDIFNDHCSFLKNHADMSGVRDDDRKALCFSRSCRKLFDMNNLALHKRCTVPGCMISFPNCGCTTMSCTTCFAPVCRLHLRAHEIACKQSAPLKCGYSSNKHTLALECCQKVLNPNGSDTKTCSQCTTRVCLDCGRVCANCDQQICAACCDSRIRTGPVECCNDPRLLPV